MRRPRAYLDARLREKRRVMGAQAIARRELEARGVLDPAEAAGGPEAPAPVQDAARSEWERARQISEAEARLQFVQLLEAGDSGSIRFLLSCDRFMRRRGFRRLTQLALHQDPEVALPALRLLSGVQKSLAAIRLAEARMQAARREGEPTMPAQVGVVEQGRPEDQGERPGVTRFVREWPSEGAKG